MWCEQNSWKTSFYELADFSQLSSHTDLVRQYFSNFDMKVMCNKNEFFLRSVPQFTHVLYVKFLNFKLITGTYELNVESFGMKMKWFCRHGTARWKKMILTHYSPPRLPIFHPFQFIQLISFSPLLFQTRIHFPRNHLLGLILSAAHKTLFFRIISFIKSLIRVS